jgi:hypothetical protein
MPNEPVTFLTLQISEVNYRMEKLERRKVFRQILWDYDIPEEDIEAVFDGRKDMAGHYTRDLLFRKILETYPWFTIIQLFTPAEIR